MKKLLFLFLFILLGCATETKYRNKLDNWIGHTKSDLILSWGIPDKSYKLDKQTQLLAYKKSVTIEKRRYWCKTTFTLKNEIIESWKVSGNDCRSH